MINIVRKSVGNCITDYPFFAYLLLREPIEEDDSVGTAATDGKRIMYSPKFLEQKKLGEVTFILLHEVMHIAMGHIWRKDMDKRRNGLLWNVATDYAVNALLHNTACAMYQERVAALGGGRAAEETVCEITMPRGILYDKKYEGKSAEQIYDELEEAVEQNKIAIVGDEGSGEPHNEGNQNNSDKNNNVKKIRAPKNHEGWDKATKGMSDEKKQEAAEEAKNIALEAREALKDRGTIPQLMKEWIDSLAAPKRDWRALLQDFVQQETNDYTLMPPDRRFADSDFMMFSFSETEDVYKDILFFVDASGSMSLENIKEVASEVQGALQQCNLTGKLYYFDAEVSKPYEIESGTDIKKLPVLGGGGTSYKPIFEIAKKEEQAAVIIILTDGYCDDYPKQSEIPVLWIYTNDSSAEKPPFGEFIHL